MKDNRVFINHIVDCINNIFSYTEGMTEADFYKNFMVQDAVIRNFEIIGEASKYISLELKNNNPHLPWREMGSMRDRLIHEYFRVDPETVWRTIQDDLPNLKSGLKQIQSF